MLSELSLVPRSSNADLARASFVTPQSMVTMLKSLGTRGLIVRTANPKGGRAMPTELTADGAKKLMVFRLAMREVEHLLLRGLSAQDQTCFRDFLEHCLESLRSERSNT